LIFSSKTTDASPIPNFLLKCKIGVFDNDLLYNWEKLRIIIKKKKYFCFYLFINKFNILLKKKIKITRKLLS